MGKKRLLAYTIMILSLIAAVRLAKDIYWFWHTEDRLAEAEQELIEAKEMRFRLQRQLEEVGSDEWRERQVRDKLMMARPNEVVVVVPSVVDNEAATKTKENKKGVGGELKNWQKWWRLFVY
jgi:hypothetical protein